MNPFDPDPPIESVIDYVFRGTTVGFPGTIHERVGLTSLTTDPVVATLFAMAASPYGRAVVYLVPVARLAGRLRDNRFNNRLSTLECEVVTDLSPTEIAAEAVSIDVETAKSVLQNMGVPLPSRLHNLSDLSDALRLTRRLSRDEVNAFVRAAEQTP